jgi:hypothetical protein
VIGIKSVIALVLAVAAISIGVWRGVFSAEHFVHLSAASAFAIGVFASLCAALVGFGWRPRLRSRTAIAVRGGKPAIIDDAVAPRELPALAQRAALVIVFATIALGTLGNEATARIGSVPADLTKPSRSEYCYPEAPSEQEPEPEPEVLPPQVDQAGCALVKRAYALGYAKSLGSCAPKTITIAPVKQAAKVVEVCTRRQLDEPFLHYAYRKVVETTSDAAPVDALSERVHGVRTRLDYTRDLLADIQHAVTGTPHASHHIWIDLPDPRPHTFRQRFTGHPPCSTHYADLPLWPAWDATTPPNAVFEHVFGQLLFATRFGTTASCSDYTLHWGAPPDACAKLAADPEGFLADSDALTSIHAVLDRRKRQIAMRELAGKLGEEPTLPEPPPARAVTSVSCLMFDGAKPVVAKAIVVEGEQLALREVHAAAIAPAGAGPIEVYKAVAMLLGGNRYAGASEGTRIEGTNAIDEEGVTPPASPAGATTPSGSAAGSPATAPSSGPAVGAPPTSPDSRNPPTPAAKIEIASTDFTLLALEPLVDADPFLANAELLDRADLVAVFPIEQHLRAFIDAFRRVYLPQRGRL